MDMEDESKIKFETNEEIKVYEDFESMNLSQQLLRGLHGYGFDKPSAVQKRAIVPIKSGRDVIVQSQSGTGKTAVFCLGTLDRIDQQLKEP